MSTKIDLSFSCTSGVRIAATIALLSFSRTSRGVFGGAISAKNVVELKPGRALSSIVGMSGSSAIRLARGRRDDPDPVAAVQLQDGAEVAEHRIDMPAGEIVHRRRRALVGHVRDLDAGTALEQLEREMGGRAVALRGVAQLVGLGVRDQLGDGLGRRVVLHRQDVRADRHDRHRLEASRDRS